MENTRPKEAPLKASNEATAEELKLAKGQGDAYRKALEYMIHEEAHGAVKPAGEYLVGYAVEKAEGLYYPVHGELVWHEPGDQNAHIEISVCDAKDGRFVPGLVVLVTVIDSKGKEIGTRQEPFLWHPWLYHYGLDWKLPGDGSYMLRVHIDPPSFARHDKKNGQRYAAPVDVEFAQVDIKTGKK